MKPALKYASILLVILALIPVAAFFAYDLFVFQPKRQEIEALLMQADPQDRNPPPLIRRYLKIAKEPTTMMVSRYLNDRFDMTAWGRMRRPLPEMMVQALLKLHLSEDEILGLYAGLAYTGQEQYGLNSLSRRLFDKPLDALMEPEAATIVAVLKAPSRYLENRNALAKRRDELLERANDP